MSDLTNGDVDRLPRSLSNLLRRLQSRGLKRTLTYRGVANSAGADIPISARLRTNDQNRHCPNLTTWHPRSKRKSRLRTEIMLRTFNASYAQLAIELLFSCELRSPGNLRTCSSRVRGTECGRYLHRVRSGPVERGGLTVVRSFHCVGGAGGRVADSLGLVTSTIRARSIRWVR